VRGGRRKRWITRHEASVWCPGGRWGPRRIRTNECWATLRAEDVYDGLLREDAPAVKPGTRDRVTYKFNDRDVTTGWEIRPNAIWRRGRVFLCCPRCGQRCTRLYMPLQDSWLACRRCWGLTYASRTLQNYKDSLWGSRQFAWMFGTTQRDWAYSTTDEKRRKLLKRSRGRWQERKRYSFTRQS
jgi:hypothetical protein